MSLGSPFAVFSCGHCFDLVSICGRYKTLFLAIVPSSRSQVEMTNESTAHDMYRRYELNCTDGVAEGRRSAYLHHLPALDS
jgi:hypothetical protein